MNDKHISNSSIQNNISVENLKLALEEMQSLYSWGQEASDELNNKAGTILGSASLILSLITTLQLTLSGTNQPWFYWLGLGIVFLLYLAMIILTLLTMFPRTYTTPIKASWEVLNEHLFQPTEKQALLNLISAYKNHIKANKVIGAQKAKLVMWSTILMALLVCLLVLLSLVVAR